MNDSVKLWYKQNYPEDRLGDDIRESLTFNKVWDAIKKGTNIYGILGVSDSFIREKVFEGLTERLHVTYDEVYTLWYKNIVK